MTGAPVNNYTKVLKIPMIMTGIWEMQDGNPAIKIIYTIYSKLLQIIYCTAVFTMAMKVGSIEDKQAADENLSLVVVNSLSIMKLLASQTGRVRSLVKEMNENEYWILQNMEKNEKRIYYNNFEYAKKVFILFGINLVCLSGFFQVRFFIAAYNFFKPDFSDMWNSSVINKPLLVIQYVPLNTDKHYLLICIIDVIAANTAVIMFMATDCLYLGMILYCIGRLEILQNVLANDCETIYYENEDKLRAKLNWCVTEYQHIIDFVRRIDSSLNFIMLLDFLLRSVQISAIIFEVIQAGFGFNILFLFFMLITALFQIFFYYWHANKLTIAHEEVGKAAYTNKWYYLNRSCQKMIFMIMIRSKKPLTLNIGIFYPMSNGVIVKIAKTIYTCLSVMDKIN